MIRLALTVTTLCLALVFAPAAFATGPWSGITACSWMCTDHGIDDTCRGSCTGSISGGTTPYTVNWYLNLVPDHTQYTSSSTVNSQLVECYFGSDLIQLQVTDANSQTSTISAWVCGAP